jgi:hypothetical protein
LIEARSDVLFVLGLRLYWHNSPPLCAFDRPMVAGLGPKVNAQQRHTQSSARPVRTSQNSALTGQPPP